MGRRGRGAKGLGERAAKPRVRVRNPFMNSSHAVIERHIVENSVVNDFKTLVSELQVCNTTAATAVMVLYTYEENEC